jgi:hypothetical protein
MADGLFESFTVFLLEQMTQKHEFVYLPADSLILYLADISMAQNTHVCNFCFGKERR